MKYIWAAAVAFILLVGLAFSTAMTFYLISNLPVDINAIEKYNKG